MPETTTDKKPCGCRVHRNRMPEGATSVFLDCEEAKKLFRRRDEDENETALYRHLDLKRAEWKP